MTSNSKEYWESYYRQNPNPSGESPFARFVSGFLNEGDSLYELGCGNGRDSVFFGKKGVRVHAFDQCEEELAYLTAQNSLSNVHFEAGDFTNLGPKSRVDFIYSRFTLHSVTEDKEIDTLRWSFDALNENGLVFIEIRSILDELYGQGEKVGKNEFVTSHYRRFVALNSFVSRIEEAGFSILYKLESKGLAPHGDDDPIVIRVVAKRAERN
ncbi:MAG: class I SAM-dependent methyltransferase [Bacteroidetes bacterium]|jgi:tellurite methyltransferase|nr:class I SAM-dependent methyltransferase [Bacteroidota bacterium]